MLDQLKRIVASLSMRQRITIGITVTLVCAALWGFTRFRNERDFKPLYTGMAAQDASAVVQKLRETGVEYRLTDGGASVLVPSARLAESRLNMASAGLPKSGRIGFELFDKANLGATEFVEHINYRRALEGELERSVMCLAEVEHARVHITFPKDSVYLEAQQPAKASVMLRVRSGTRLAPQNVPAIAHLVASAVEGLRPEAVSVLDMQGNLLSRPRKKPENGTEPTEEMIEVRQKIERDLVAKINNTLEPLLGPDKFRAAASVECDFTSGEQSEETFDPTKTVMATSQKTEDTTMGATALGVPGTPSNLPRQSAPAAAPTGMTRRTENITYQTSRVTRRTRLAEGSIKRISMAVLLDQRVRWEGKQRVVVPPTADTLKTIRELIAGVAGLVPARGDQLIIESLPFDSTLRDEPPVAATPVSAPVKPSNLLEDISKNRMVLIMAILGSAALLTLLRGILRFLRRNTGTAQRPETPAALQGPDNGELGAPFKSLEHGDEEFALSEHVQSQPRSLPPSMAAELRPGPVVAQESAERIRQAVQKDVSIPVYLIKAWLNESKA